MLKSIKPKKWVVAAYLAVPVALYVFTVFAPLVAALFYSFFEWKGGPVKTFNGLANYSQLIHDQVFWSAFWHNIFLVVVCIIGQIGLAFIVVLLINSKVTKLQGIHRTFGFFPSTISAVSSISTEVLESAEIDGATGIQRARYIVLPLIKNTLLVCITLCVAGNMKAFDNIYVMTSGGPGYSSMVMAMYGYKVSFEQSNLGYGSCISVGIFVLALAVIGGSQVLMNYFMTDSYDRNEKKHLKQIEKERKQAMKNRKANA